MQGLAFTGVILLCRSLLTHVAEEQGAPKGTFNQAVEYLDKEGYIPKNAKPGLVWIKDKGNESAHDMIVFEQEEATRVMDFTAFMLKVIYEFPSSVPPKP
jgi:hypothetical protein